MPDSPAVHSPDVVWREYNTLYNPTNQVVFIIAHVLMSVYNVYQINDTTWYTKIGTVILSDFHVFKKRNLEISSLEMYLQIKPTCCTHRILPANRIFSGFKSLAINHWIKLPQVIQVATDHHRFCFTNFSTPKKKKRLIAGFNPFEKY